MYRIGTAARLAQVSVRTLRHYDDVGLLSPAKVDSETGYRWYGPEQLARLHRILALRDLGVPLGEIAELLGKDVTVEHLRGILLLRRTRRPTTASPRKRSAWRELKHACSSWRRRTWTDTR